MEERREYCLPPLILPPVSGFVNEERAVNFRYIGDEANTNTRTFRFNQN